MWITTSLPPGIGSRLREAPDSGQKTEENASRSAVNLCRTRPFINSSSGVSVIYPTVRPLYEIRGILMLISNICAMTLQNCQQPSSRGVSLILKEQRSQMTLQSEQRIGPHPWGLLSLERRLERTLMRMKRLAKRSERIKQVIEFKPIGRACHARGGHVRAG